VLATAARRAHGTLGWIHGIRRVELTADR